MPVYVAGATAPAGGDATPVGATARPATGPRADPRAGCRGAGFTPGGAGSTDRPFAPRAGRRFAGTTATDRLAITAIDRLKQPTATHRLPITATTDRLEQPTATHRLAIAATTDRLEEATAAHRRSIHAGFAAALPRPDRSYGRCARAIRMGGAGRITDAIAAAIRSGGSAPCVPAGGTRRAAAVAAPSVVDRTRTLIRIRRPVAGSSRVVARVAEVVGARSVREAGPIE